jgi:hypothetical protein
MKPPTDFEKIIDRKRYSTKTAALLAGNDYWDGHNFERSGRNTFLYHTPQGAYFYVNLTCWQGEQDTLIPCSLDEAIELFEGSLTEHRVDYSEAFPDVTIEDA